MMLRKQGALNNQMLRVGCCLSPPIKIPGYVPVWLYQLTEKRLHRNMVF